MSTLAIVGGLKESYRFLSCLLVVHAKGGVVVAIRELSPSFLSSNRRGRPYKRGHRHRQYQREDLPSRSWALSLDFERERDRDREEELRLLLLLPCFSSRGLLLVGDRQRFFECSRLLCLPLSRSFLSSPSFPFSLPLLLLLPSSDLLGFLTPSFFSLTPCRTPCSNFFSICGSRRDNPFPYPMIHSKSKQSEAGPSGLTSTSFSFRSMSFFCLSSMCWVNRCFVSSLTSASDGPACVFPRITSACHGIPATHMCGD